MKPSLLISFEFSLEKEVARTFQSLVSFFQQCAILTPAHRIHCLAEVPRYVELVVHDGGLRRFPPHVHCGGFYLDELGSRQRCFDERLSAFFRPILHYIEYTSTVEVSHERRVSVPFEERFFVNSSVPNHLLRAPREPSLHGTRSYRLRRIPADLEEYHCARDI